MSIPAPSPQHRLSAAITDLMVIGDIINALGEREPIAGENIEGAWLCWLATKMGETTAEAHSALEHILKADQS